MMRTGIYISLTIVLFTIFSFTGCRRRDSIPIDNVFRFKEILTVDGLQRTYTLNLPPTYYTSSDFSLVIAMHGGGGNADQFETTSKLTDKANTAGFIVVYPEGVQSDGLLKARTWNAGGCCDYARDHNIDDVNFIRQLINHLISTYKINPKRVYATGHSNGGMLSYRLACEMPEKIAAIATSSCTMVVKQPCNPSRPVPVLHMHSVKDEHVPYKGGVGISNAYFPPVDSVLNVWSAINACSNPAQVLVNDNRYKYTKWSDCEDNATIQYYLTQDGGHGWPGGLPGGPNSDTPSTVINANDLLWDFFQQYQLP
ncbi:alpha/beta hydrolase family esterase [Xanthocytophaga agilis]|uniref:extracellular catalytic domain type 1 short-chain-length polyhydroxyalkanoate depolymerase n=1 Tax=Xanthocytophaga agilis TaxID=3048010 RepID=UPI0028D69E1A|nr:PHB depolymerase family esterase [Xanthocytophaga agilis]